MDYDKRSDFDREKMSPRYRKGNTDRRRRVKSKSRSRSPSRTNSHSRSRSSSSSSSSSHSSSSSSRHHSDYKSRRSSSKSNRDKVYKRKSSRSYPSKREDDRKSSNWFPSRHSSYPGQGQDISSSTSYHPSQYSSSVQGAYPTNFQSQQNFNRNYERYDTYESSGTYYRPPNPHNFSQPPISHEYICASSTHPPVSSWEPFPDNIQLPPPTPATGAVPVSISCDSLTDIKAEEAKKEAIEHELLQQKKTLSKQREDYIKRKFSINRELNRLKDQKRELLKENSKENERILRENAKLQNEIQHKLKSIDNVIEMLTNIIGDSARLSEVINEIKSTEVPEKKKTEKRKREISEDRESSDSSEVEQPHDRDKDRNRERDRVPEENSKDENKVYYDPGLHWCADCNVFPKSVSEYLDHLHSSEHKKNTKLKFDELPWHAGQNLEEKQSSQSNKGSSALVKRIPIRGVQFLIPATAWFCSMCKVWLGDTHCADKHVQSNLHSNCYNEFIMKNQHWEVDWLTERTKSYERNSEAKQQQQQPTSVAPPLPPSGPLSIASLSDQLLAMIAANSKLQEAPSLPPPPPPPPLTKSSSSDDESPGRKSKKKKSKKSKKNKEAKSPSRDSDKTKLNYKVVPDKKINESFPDDDNFIAEWMPKVEKREAVQIKSKQKSEEPEIVKPTKKKKSNDNSPDSRGTGGDKAITISPTQQHYYDEGDAGATENKSFTWSVSSYEKEPRSKKKEEESSRYDRHSKYDRSPKEKCKYDERYNKYNKYDRHKQEDKDKDYKNRKDHKSYLNEKERNKKSPITRIKELKDKESERRKIKGKFSYGKTDEYDVHETIFEKRTSESAAKKKDIKKPPVIASLSKAKLPFIGRMPILKKKTEQKVEEKKDIEDSASKDSIPELAMLREEPAVVQEAQDEANEKTTDELPKSTLIISKRPRLAEPGIVKKEILFNKPVNDNLTEQDMDLDDDGANIPKEEETQKDELHKDFKDALDLLFPEEKKSDKKEVETGENTEVKLDEQQQAMAAAAATSAYMMATGYDMSMYQYYDPAYLQQWAQMGYDTTGQYAYAYPPPAMEGVQQAPMDVVHQASLDIVQQTSLDVVQQTSLDVVQQTSIDVQQNLMGVAVPLSDVPVANMEMPSQQDKKKKKNPKSQRLRRHLQKKKAMEAAARAGQGDPEEINYDTMEMEECEFEGEDDGEFEEAEIETESGDNLREEDKRENTNNLSQMADLAMLGIDEDDAAAQRL